MIRKIVATALCALSMSCTSMYSFFDAGKPILPESQQADLAKVKLLVSVDALSENYKKKHGNELPRDLAIPLSPADEAKLIALLKRVKVKKCRMVTGTVFQLIYIKISLCDKDGKVLEELYDPPITSECPDYLINEDRYFYLPEEDAKRFWDIVDKAIDEQDVYYRKLYNPNKDCSCCQDSD